MCIRDRNASAEELEEVNEVGPRIAESIVEFFTDEHNRKLVSDLRKAGLTFTGQKKEKGTKLAGKTFVLTGTLARHTRDEAKTVSYTHLYPKAINHTLEGQFL